MCFGVRMVDMENSPLTIDYEVMSKFDENGIHHLKYTHHHHTQFDTLLECLGRFRNQTSRRAEIGLKKVFFYTNSVN